jgi:electron transport complex protein RnfG
MIRLIVVLAVITFVAAMGLGFVYESTAPKIEEQKRITDELAMRTALPDAACGIFVQKDWEGFTYFQGYRDADTTDFVGYVVKAAGRGYSSTIETMVGVNREGKITGLKITHQQETPGLGTKIEEVKSAKTVLDAIKELAGKGEPARVAIDLADETGTVQCMEVELRDEAACTMIANHVAQGDTAALGDLAPRAFCLVPQDSSRVFCSPPLTFDVASKVIEKLREQQTPWFLKQFIGKPYGGLLVSAQKSDRYIQGITGATISSVAVTESVREAMTKLEQAVGGFEGTEP